MTKITLDCRKGIVLDWNDGTHWNSGKQSACIHCSQPGLLLDDVGRPAHKVCAQSALAALINKRNERTAA
jgi:hypothetical protein